MAETAGTFSESWYRIADQRVALRPHLNVRRQFYRGARWHVVHDPVNNQFFRLRAPAYDFISRLRLDRTIGEAWRDCLEAHPNDAPGQEDVIRLLAQLYGANLLHSNLTADSAKLFERQQLRRDREVKSKLLNVMFSRIPIFDPDELLKSWMPLLRLIISPMGAIIWLLVVGAGVKLALDNASILREQSEGILSPNNLFLLYAGFILIKTIHEFGHAAMCRRFGGEVHTMGVMFMVFTPMPYVDATSSWSFRERWQRILVGAGGMIPELLVAACAMFVWANTGEGTIHSLAYNMMFVASVSTLMFNANPLMRFDGYYILSDLLDIPNLYFRANQQLTYLIEKYAFGCAKTGSPAHGAREAWWLGTYGLSGHIYRTIVFAVILFFLSKRYMLLGAFMALVCLISWVVLPVVKLGQYLATSPKLERKRPRAVGICVGVVALVLALLGFVPFPNDFKAPGVVDAWEHSIVVTESSGYIDALLAPPGSLVTRGQPLVRIRDTDLNFEIAGVRGQFAENEALELRAMREQTADLQPIRSRKEAIQKHLRHLEARRESLTLRARNAGKWIAPEIDHLTGAWIPRGLTLGQVVNTTSFNFVAVVSEQDASRLFTPEIRGAEVRLHGQAGRTLAVTGQRIMQAEHNVLPSPALGWQGGGEVAVQGSDQTGVRAAEPFFEVRASIDPLANATILQGASGKIRFMLAPEPLLKQWARRVRQLMQKHYGV